MKILNFAPNSPYNQYQNRFNCPNKNAANPLGDSGLSNNSVLNSYPLAYYLYHGQDLSFTARVDKGLERFYAVNKDLMPNTVKKYIDSIAPQQVKSLSPIAAQQNAFEELIIAENIDDVKALFPDEPLFEDLKSINENKAKRGILYDMKIIQKDLENEGSSILKNGEDLTVYLLKKIFLENKTLKQINEDLNSDLNPVFCSEDKEYMNYSTLASLGIKLPKNEYLTSLRYTKEGYSDDIGEKISERQSTFWESLTDEEKLERRKKSLSQLENWWNNLSNEDKMELLEKKDSEIKLLNAFKNDTLKAAKQADNTREQLKQADGEQKQSKSVKAANKSKEKLKTTLSNDEMFLEWARKNLEIFELGLSDEQKAELSQKRAEAQFSRWQNLSSEEKTALIEKMQSGRINQKMAMVDAWNNCSDIREHLSNFMKENNLHGPHGIIYKDGTFSEAQSRIMTAFWEKYPEDAIKLGDEIRNSFAKIKESIKNDTFDDLKILILDVQAKIKKNAKVKKKGKTNSDADASKNALKDAQKRFMESYHETYYFIPQDFRDSYCKFAIDNLKDAYALDIWTRMNFEKPEPDKIKYLVNKITPIQDTPEMFRKKRAIEQAMAEVLYEASDKSNVAKNLFGAKFKDLQVILLLAEARIIFPIEINCGKDLNIVLNKRPDYSKLEELYKKYRRPLNSEATEKIVQNGVENMTYSAMLEGKPLKTNQIFTFRKALDTFVQMYGASAGCILNDSGCAGCNYAERKFTELEYSFRKNLRKQS